MQALHRKLKILLYLALIFFCAGSSHALENDYDCGKRILVLHTFKAQKPWVMLFNRYLSEGLGHDKLACCKIDIETLDLLEHNDALYMENLARLLIYKYSKSPHSIIILTFSPAIDFIINQKLFSETPKILVLPSASGYKDIPKSIVLPMAVDFKGSIEHSIELLPDTKEIYVIAGNADVDKHTVAMFSDDTKDIDSRISFIYLTELSIADLLNRVERLPENSFIYYLSYSLDSSGSSIIARDFCRLIGKRTNRPVFTYLDLFALGTGILGGRVSTTKASVSSSVDVIKRVFNGEAIDTIEAPKPYFEYIYDWTEIKRWGIDEKKLPRDSILQNRTYSLFEMFKWKILGGFLITSAESFLIIFLFLNIRRRKAAEGKLLDYSSELKEMVDGRTTELNETILRLKTALNEIKTLKGIIPICSTCKKIRDDKGNWNKLEAYINKHSEAKLSHSFCPECAKEQYRFLNIDEDEV